MESYKIDTKEHALLGKTENDLIVAMVFGDNSRLCILCGSDQFDPDDGYFCDKICEREALKIFDSVVGCLRNKYFNGSICIDNH